MSIDSRAAVWVVLGERSIISTGDDALFLDGIYSASATSYFASAAVYTLSIFFKNSERLAMMRCFSMVLIPLL